MMAELKAKGQEVVKYGRRKHDDTPWWVRGAVLAVGAGLMALLVVTLVLSNNAKNASEDAQHAVAEVSRLTEQNRTNAIATCEAGNVSRQASVRGQRADVKNLLADIDGIQADIDGLERFGIGNEGGQDSDLDWVSSKYEQIEDKREAVRSKREAINGQLDSIASVAVAPNSPIKNCEAANPK